MLPIRKPISLILSTRILPALSIAFRSREATSPNDPSPLISGSNAITSISEKTLRARRSSYLTVSAKEALQCR